MASFTYELTLTPKAAPDYTAVADTDIQITNPYVRADAIIRYERTTNDTPPTLSPDLWTPVLPGEKIPFTVLNGERLWFIGPEKYLAKLEA